MNSQDIYSRILELTSMHGKVKPAALNRLAHETLVLVCHEALKDSRQAYGNLFSQVDFLCRQHHVPTKDRVAIQTMRRHCNHKEAVEREEFLYDMRALCRFVSAITHSDIPSEVWKVLPITTPPYPNTGGIDLKCVRCIVTGVNEFTVFATAEQALDGGRLSIDCSAEAVQHVCNLATVGTQLNVLDAKITDRHHDTEGTHYTIVPTLVVVEPDYLIDISAIAACFKDYGHHPLQYVIDRMKPRANSQAILLGHFAGQALDDIVNKGDDFRFADTLNKSFADHVLNYCTCKGFVPEKFKQEAWQQTRCIREAAEVMFAQRQRQKAILEPSFVCEGLGLQGRVDLMTTDFSLLVEQKSGKNINIEHRKTGKHGSTQLESHYVQLVLYYVVLRYNFRLDCRHADIHLLYSGYPPQLGLMSVAFYRNLFLEAIRLRNHIVATDYHIARHGFDSIIGMLTPETLNTSGDHSMFYNRYLLPQIEQVTKPLQAMPPLEREYFCRMMTFVYREQLLSKVGTQEGVSSCMADLWNMPLTEKIETGNIYMGLTIKAKTCVEGNDVPQRITLRVPGQEISFLPNFRRGDMVYLYAYKAEDTPDARKSILYRGNIEDIKTDEITIVLTNGQQTPEVLKVQPMEGVEHDGQAKLLYAVEHAASDSTTASAARGLHELITAPDERKALLLGQRPPQCDKDISLSKSYHDNYDDILLKAMQTKDYFLLSGPPGTGKTSMALRFMVVEELTKPHASLLLTAYTNRAVDEICAMLDDARIDYIRMGSEYSADPRFKHHLMGEMAKTCHRLDNMRRLLADTRVVVGTTSTLMGRPFIFDIKHFSLAIMDEASQILEPAIIGLLAAHRPTAGGREQTCIDRFVLVGDHKQLPAVVQQDEATSAVTSERLRSIHLDNCRNSLFERLLRTEKAAERTTFNGTLRRQGRMHPDVATFPCSRFYADEQLTPVPLPHQQSAALPYHPDVACDETDRMLLSHRLLFVPSPYCRHPEVSDKVNTAEAAIVAQLLKRIRTLLGNDFDAAKSIGVIVPYRNQIAMIRKEIELTGLPELLQTSIDTVERYQGSQRDVIIYSFTVQNPWQMEFLTANCFTEEGHVIDRKLNVALTRARHQMIMTGNINTLSTHPTFRDMLDYIQKRGGMLSL